MPDYESFLSGKRITVMGLGLLGRGVGDIAFLAKYAREVTVTDLKTAEQLKESVAKLKRFKNIRYTLGKHDTADFENRDFILKAAGVPADSLFINHAVKRKVPVYMSTALFVKFARERGATTIGITGTRGKTTVTYMAYEALVRHYRGTKRTVFLGGNIQGVSTIALLPKVKKGDILMLELDSWQLQGFGDLGISPDIAVFTTFMPDHLNYYGGKLKPYAEDKAKIFLNQKKSDIFIASMQAKKALAKLVPFPARTILADQKKTDYALAVPGEHNQLNARLAAAVLRACGLGEQEINARLAAFRGVPGRLEYIGTVKGRKVYNDTTATTPHAAAAALEALGDGRNISLILGGNDKQIALVNLKKPIAAHCAFVALLEGSGTERLMKEKIIAPKVLRARFSSFAPAVKAAVAKAPKGGIVLLSPGFASFGMFANEYDRGDQFRAITKKMMK